MRLYTPTPRGVTMSVQKREQVKVLQSDIIQ